MRLYRIITEDKDLFRGKIMLPVYICENDEAQLNFIKKAISNTIFIEDMDASVVCAVPSPNMLLTYLLSHRSPSLYFLDIELNDKMNGFMLALEIRKYDPRGFIVFMSTHSDLSHFAFKYKTEAMDFIPKDDPKVLISRIQDCIRRTFELYTDPFNTVHKTIALKIDRRIITFKMDEIYCIETTGEAHKIRISRRSSHTELFYSLKSIVNQLDDSFYQCHKSCIVNLAHIRYIDKKNCSLTLDNGKTCPVATRLLQSLSRRLTF